jgi:hypothetical protein
MFIPLKICVNAKKIAQKFRISRHRLLHKIFETTCRISPNPHFGDIGDLGEMGDLYPAVPILKFAYSQTADNDFFGNFNG